MNQFNSIDFKGNKKALKVAEDFDYILNNIWCTYTVEKGRKRWDEICKTIPQQFSRGILTEIGHVECGHGVVQARLSVKTEMVNYLRHLIETA